jgi:sulfur transfer complex TusBCD TusB component (DsrH family)
MTDKIYLLNNCANLVSLPGSSLLNCVFCKNCNIYAICNKIDLINRGVLSRIDESNKVVMYKDCYKFTNEHLINTMRYREWRNTYYQWKVDLLLVKNKFDLIFNEQNQ